MDTLAPAVGEINENEMMMPASPIVIDEEAQREKEEAFDFTKAKPYISSLKQDFDPEITLTQANRKLRKVDVNLEEERRKKNIKQSDTIVPMRVIDESINREQPGFIGYLQNSRRLIIMVDKLDPSNKPDDLEAAFTRGMTYEEWLIPHKKAIDGAQLHGWDWYEVLYDSTKPLHCAVEAVGHDRLIFPLDCEDIQNCGRVMREFRWTRSQLKHMTRVFGFNKEQVNKLLNFQQDGSSSNSGVVKDKTYTVYKLYQKVDGIVYTGWCSLDACDDWLKAPDLFYNGVDEEVAVSIPVPPQTVTDPITGAVSIVPMPPQITYEWQPRKETKYPLVLLPYEETEEKGINTKTGRAFKDKFKQEVMTVGWSSYLNGHNRATWLYASKGDAHDGTPAQKLESFVFEDGVVAPFVVNWHTLPYPDPAMLQGLQAFDSKIATGNGQMTYAVQSKSSGARTTAKEVESAQNDTALLASVNLTLFAGTIRKVYTIAWEIVQSQALQGKVNLYGQIETITDPNTGAVLTEEFVNNIEMIERDYDIRPAGDIDVIQRQEQLAGMQEFWEVVANTPIAAEYLGEMLVLKFGEKGQKWAKMLQQADPRLLLQQAGQILAGLLQQPGSLMQASDQEMQNLAMLVQQITQVLGQTQNANQQQQQRSTGGGTGSSGDKSGQGAVAGSPGNTQSSGTPPQA